MVLFAILFVWQHPHFYAIVLDISRRLPRGGIKMFASRRAQRQRMFSPDNCLLDSFACRFAITHCRRTYWKVLLLRSVLSGLPCSWLLSRFLRAEAKVAEPAGF